jgi:hypothetical protein
MIPSPLKSLRSANAAIGRLSLTVARFLTQMGSSRTESYFWRTGAAISAIGTAIVIATELGTIAFLLTIPSNMNLQGWGSLLLHAAFVFVLIHFIIGIVRGIREPHHSVQPQRNPK